MGTRGLIGFIIKGVRKGAYNHFDSYPEGLGNDIVKFILALRKEDIIKMQTLVEAVSTRCSAIRRLPGTLADPPPQLVWVTEIDSSTTHNRDLLQRVWEGQKEVVDATDFLYDGMFCEYAYFVDFDKRRIEVFAGWEGLTAMWSFEGLAKDRFVDIYKVGERRERQKMVGDGNGTDGEESSVETGVDQ